jgi:hypothetical protein
MKRWFIAALLVLGLATPWVRVQAQTPLEIETLQVDIWPEYDKPDVLVIYHLTIAGSSSLPAQVSLKIPKLANAPANLAMKDVDGLLYNLKYDQAVDGNWLRISFTAPSADIQLEYYDPSLTLNSNARTYDFVWPGDYRVRNMTLRIQQPVNATDLKLTKNTLKMDSGTKGDDGLVYYIVPISGAVEAGMSFDVPFVYLKPDSILISTTTQGPVKVGTVTGGITLAGGLASTNNILWIGLGAGILFIFIGLFWYFNQQRMSPAAATPNRRRHTAPTRPRESTTVVSDEAIYCHQCGKRAGPEDAFCRACGTKLRE